MNLGSQNKLLSILFFIILLFFSKIIIAENVNGHTVTIGALDKITAKFSEFDIKINESKKFGSLIIEIFRCEKRPPEEIPEDFVLLKIVDEINKENPSTVFSGWMLSSSPSLSPLQHPTYDIWVKDCKIEKDSF